MSVDTMGAFARPNSPAPYREILRLVGAAIIIARCFANLSLRRDVSLILGNHSVWNQAALRGQERQGGQSKQVATLHGNSSMGSKSEILRIISRSGGYIRMESISSDRTPGLHPGVTPLPFTNRFRP